MKKTLYLLRKPVEQIDSALFLPAKSQGDVVLMEGGGAGTFSYAGGQIFSMTDHATDHGLTYDELVKKIFACDQTVVI
jgi:hypothetical protein